MSLFNDGDPYFDDAPGDELDDELQCPLCDHVVYVSPEDGDASLSEMVGHLRTAHHGHNVSSLLAKVKLTPGGAR